MCYTNLLYTELPYRAGHEAFFTVLKSILFLGLQFRRFDDDGYRAYNHHLWERGLLPFNLVVIYPEVPAFAPMLNWARATVERHVQEDFNAQGSYSEHSFAYWTCAALGEMLSRSLKLAQRNDVKLLSADSLARLRRSFDWVAQLSPPTKHFVSMGDNGPPEIEPILRIGAEVFDSALCRQVLALRVAASNDIDKRMATDQASLPLVVADDRVGFAALRSDYGTAGHYAVLSAKVDCGGTGHNHMDMTSFCLAIGGQPVIGEPYTARFYHRATMASPERGFYYNMGSHNLVLAHGEAAHPDADYANRWGVYRPDSLLTAVVETERGGHVSCYHDAYTFCRVERSLHFDRAGAWLVMDSLERGYRKPAPHIQRNYLFPGIVPRRLAEDAVLLEGERVRALLLYAGAAELRLWQPSEQLERILWPGEVAGWAIDACFASRYPENAVVSSLHTLILDARMLGEDLDLEAWRPYLEPARFIAQSFAELLPAFTGPSEQVRFF